MGSSSSAELHVASAAESLLVFVVQVFGAFAAAGLFVAVHDQWGPPLPVTALSVLYLCAAIVMFGGPVSTAFHEFGHAWAARRSGLHVKTVRIGGGRLLLSRPVKGTQVEIRLRPFEGLTVYDTTDTVTVGQLRWVIRAGPLANVVLALGALASTVVLPPVGAVGAAGFAMVNLNVLLANMIDQHPAAQALGTDGWQLGELRGLPRGMTRREIPMKPRGDLLEKPGIAAKRLLRFLRDHSLTPDQARDARIQLAYHCGRMGRFDEAAALYEDLCRTELPEGLRTALPASWTDAVLSAAVMSGEPPSAEVLTRCRETIEAAWGLRGVRHTASLLALVEEKPSEAVILAEESLREESLFPEERAIVEATISLAYAKSGDNGTARGWLEQVPESCPFSGVANRALL